MEQTENPLLSLSSEKQQQIVDLVDNGDIEQIAEKGGMTRRQVLQVAVALGAGATAGGYSVDQIIGEARAAADTSDSDGNVGLPGDRVDLFAEGADISGTATANQVGTSSDRFTGFAADLDANSVSTGSASVGGQGPIQYWPVNYMSSSTKELDTNSPATTATTVSMSAPPSDAYGVALLIVSVGDGSADIHRIRTRRNGDGVWQGRVRGWAGHSASDARTVCYVPMDTNNEIQYETQNSAQAQIFSIGYY